MVDEAQLRAEIRAELEAEMRGDMEEQRRKQDLDAHFAPVVQSARREQSWDSQRPIQGAPVTTAANIIGTVLAEQMLAGMPGTHLHEDGFGDGS